jgi:hypothetical protein
MPRPARAPAKPLDLVSRTSLLVLRIRMELVASRMEAALAELRTPRLRSMAGALEDAAHAGRSALPV